MALAVDALGPDPFSSTPFGTDRSHVQPVPDGGVRAGDLPGLYGGSLRKKTCDKASLVKFLMDGKNAQKARVWAEVRGIGVRDIPAYVKKLTPVLLRNDTLVKNHGFRNGAKTVFEALLEAGIEVLVDDRGQPVVKCNCGNPLAAPDIRDPADISPDIIGDAEWRRTFSPRRVTIVRPDTTRRVRRFHLIDIDNGRGIGRPAGANARDVRLPAPSIPPGDQRPADPASPAAPSIVGTWRSSGPISSLISVEPGDAGAFIGVLASDLQLGPGCVLRAGRRTWSMRGAGPDYTGSVTAVDMTNCGELSEVPATWRLTGHDTLTICLDLDQLRCETLARTDG
ncbi:DUF6777 domain-containing protein [Planobispora siamensis]|uniref:DUF6777 domain-containing protein n=1 Tax=Planobispora siamensis TaxID=936338 RepID=UPI001951CA4E|nr:DUF6777 domain-containing protein [Planobispora siamensis]